MELSGGLQSFKSKRDKLEYDADCSKWPKAVMLCGCKGKPRAWQKVMAGYRRVYD